MTRHKNHFSTICFGILLFASVGYAAAQQAAMATNPSGKPFFQSVSLKTGEERIMDFSLRAVGPVSGRVFKDAELAATSTEANHPGIASVKVTLRSRDAGNENFVLVHFTDAIGAYKFVGLRPGKYSIVIDPADLPANFSVPTVSDSFVDLDSSRSSYAEGPLAPQRAITGIVFVDKDGDGRYRHDKDRPVEGAYIVIDGHFTTSDSNGAYTLRDLPAGRVGLVVSWPQTSENTHVVLDLSDGRVTNRVVNIPKSR